MTFTNIILQWGPCPVGTFHWVNTCQVRWSLYLDTVIPCIQLVLHPTLRLGRNVRSSPQRLRNHVIEQIVAITNLYITLKTDVFKGFFRIIIPFCNTRYIQWSTKLHILKTHRSYRSPWARTALLDRETTKFPPTVAYYNSIRKCQEDRMNFCHHIQWIN